MSNKRKKRGEYKPQKRVFHGNQFSGTCDGEIQISPASESAFDQSQTDHIPSALADTAFDDDLEISDDEDDSAEDRGESDQPEDGLQQ